MRPSADVDPFSLLARRGAASYGGESVSQLEHALQSASLAEQAGASPELVVAALFHDIGHLLSPHSEDATARDLNTRHEYIGSRFLTRWFAAEVTEPVRLHVEAKRYLSRVSEYAATLSEESVRSLALQGGPMTDDEARRFESSSHFDHAVRLRRWDDAAKIIAWRGPDLEHFQSMIDRVRK